MLTTPDEIEQPGSLAERLSTLLADAEKPLAAVIDCGPLYDDLVRKLRAGGVPVFRSADQAIRSLGRYLCHRDRAAQIDSATAVEADAESVVQIRKKTRRDAATPVAEK